MAHFYLATLAHFYMAIDDGAYPSRLTALVPDYLSQAPSDPFDPKQKLRYKRLPSQKYLLYSVGPDGKDDGGKPIFDPKGKNDRRKHYVREDSKGDIVAWVNMY